MLATLWSAVLIFAAFVMAPIMFAGTLFVGAVVSLAAWQERRRAQHADERADDDLEPENLAFAASKPATISGLGSAADIEPLPTFRRQRRRRSRRTEWIPFTVALLLTVTGMCLIGWFIWFVGFRR